MAVMVDGLPMPAIVAGHAALEICNTRAGWSGGAETHEYLLSYHHLAVWARHAGLTPVVAHASPAAGARVLDRALRFRAEYYAALTGGAPDWTFIDAETRRTGAGLAPDPHGQAVAVWDVGDDAELPIRAIVHAAAGMLTSPVSRQVSACPGAGCGWLFHDPRGRRRWCVMAVCGNRAKAARHAAAQRGAPILKGGSDA
jgi:predicted RNA-binding Zn ribbon-like protein